MASTYTWSVIAGVPPTGLVLDIGETGLVTSVSGTPTTAGVYNFTVRVTNDITGAFDDQAFNITVIYVYIHITPDLGTPMGELFDSSNGKLISISLPVLTDIGDVDVALRQSPNGLRLKFGSSTYPIPPALLRGMRLRNRKYLYKASNAPDNIRALWIV